VKFCNMKKCKFLSHGFLFLSLSCAQNVEKYKEEKRNDNPNIIILFADDLGYGDLSCYGHPTIKTPNLDNMASEGMKFTQFYVSSSVCSPSRGALLTGRLPVRTGLYGIEKHVFFCESNGGIPQSEITLSQALKNQEYKTACIGKWHLGHKNEFLPLSKGFDYFFGLPYSNDMSPANNDWDGVKNCRTLPLMRNNEIIENEPCQDSLTIRYTNEALKFITAQKENKFFLYLPYTFPHTPLHVSEKFKVTSKRGLYGDVVSEIDWSVGKIIQCLKENNLDKNTFVFFTSDNNPWLMRDLHGGSAGLLKEGKATTWEGGVRVPGIAWWPGVIEAGEIEHAAASTMDLFVTIAHLADYKLPNDRMYDGVDISPVFYGQTPEKLSDIFFYKGSELFAIRTGKWKMHLKTIIEPFNRHGNRTVETHDTPLLYNLEKDPSEKYDVSDTYPEIIQEIEKAIIYHRENLEIPEPEFDK
jgi:arylsulfatase A